MTSVTRGWIFFCNNQTQDENFNRSIVGTYAKYLPRFHDLIPGDPVLLYNYEICSMIAHFVATSEPYVVTAGDNWSLKYPAQVSVRLAERFPKPMTKKELRSFPDLIFDDRGYLMNFSLPIEVILDILDVASGRKKKSGEILNGAEKSFRKKFPAKFLASDGHWVRSRAELVIDNWLYSRHIAHAYERRLPVPEEAYADFYIPIGDCYIEYWGLDTSEYTDRQKKKRELFKKYAFRVVELDDRDIEELDDRLPRKLLECFPKGYMFH